ncbi:hypothetical protein diail_1464 [Diaporthe ilicicola]|nr:hypothetical protein diail_1464 [Diaporthe ilicicola]
MSTEKQTITVALPPTDQNPRDYYISLYLVFKTEDQLATTNSLNKGLARLTNLLPWIGGHVFRPDGAVPRERHISWPEPPVPSSVSPQLQEAPAPPGMPTLEELARTHAPLPVCSDNMGGVPSYADPNVPSPVLGGSYMRVDGGALVISVWVHHNVVDGHGLDVLVRLWADCTRVAAAGGSGGGDQEWLTTELTAGRIPAADEPSLRKSMLLDAFRDTLGDAEVHRIANLPDPFEQLAARHGEYTFGPVDAAARAELQKLLTRRGTWATKLFRFPIGRLERLRGFLEQIPGADGAAPGGRLSINSTLNALLWAIITRVKVDAGYTGETSEFTTAVDGRSRLGLGTVDSKDRPAYMGNLSLQTQATLSLEALLEASRCTSEKPAGSLRRAADQIAQSVAALDAGRFYEFFTLVGRAEQVTRLYKGFFPGGEMHLMCSSWAGFGAYDCDFGSAGAGAGARPLFVRTPYINRLRNVMLVLPRRRGDGADEVVEVVVSLDGDILEALDNDSVFQSWRV